MRPPASPARRGKPGTLRLTIELPEAIAGRLLQYCAYPRRRLGSVVAEALQTHLAKFYTVGSSSNSTPPEPPPLKVSPSDAGEGESSAAA